MPFLAADVELLEADVWAALHGSFANEAGEQFAAVEWRGRATLLASRASDAAAINRAIGFGFDQPFGLTQLADVCAFYKRHGKTRWFLECSPAATIDPAHLRDVGGVIGGGQIKLVASLYSLGPLVAPSLNVVEVLASERDAYSDLVGPELGVPEVVRRGIASTLGQPGWHFYFATIEGQRVAGAAMYTQGPGAWFGLASTVAAFRNRGAQTSLLLRRLQDARAAGCEWVSAEAIPDTFTPNPSLRNMKRLGLCELYHRPWYRFQDHSSKPSR
jgi:hypothetical protein